MAAVIGDACVMVSSGATSKAIAHAVDEGEVGMEKRGKGARRSHSECMGRSVSRTAGLLSVCVILSCAPLRQSDEQLTYQFRPEAPKEISGRVRGGKPINRRIEASAVGSFGDGRHILVADDKDAGLLIVDTVSGDSVVQIFNEQLMSAADQSPVSRVDDTPLRIKWEAMAEEGGVFYLLASHSGKRFSDVNAVLLRFTLDVDRRGVPSIVGNVRRWRLDYALSQEGLYPNTEEEDRVKLEGLAVWREPASGRAKLAIGVRAARPFWKEDDGNVRIYEADISDDLPNEAQLCLKERIRYDPGSRGGVRFHLSSLEYIHQLGGLVAVTATESEDETFHGNALWAIGPAANGKPRKLWGFDSEIEGKKMKAEGLCALSPGGVTSSDSVLQLCIVYDNDNAASGALQIVAVSED